MEPIRLAVTKLALCHGGAAAATAIAGKLHTDALANRGRRNAPADGGTLLCRWNAYRSDITRNTSDGSVVEGIPLTLVINVHAVDEGTCIPLRGAQVDIWHAYPQRVYSGVQEQSTTGKNFLRGYQVTNDTGAVVLSTVFPGWYEGRAIHIHVKVRTFEGAEEAFE